MVMFSIIFMKYFLVVLLQLSKSVPKPRFFSKTEPHQNRGFKLSWRFQFFNFELAQL